MYFRLSLQYLHLVEAVIDESIKQGNQQVVISDSSISESDFYEKTKWSDFNIAEPTLFNLYHGIELLLKGYLKSCNTNVTSQGHKIDNLFSSFQNNFSDKKSIAEALKKYIGSNSELVEPLKSFFYENNITVSQYYDALRYPTDKKEIITYSHYTLKGKGEKVIPFFKELRADIDFILRESVKYWRNL